jgi:leucyl aminopeptidase
VRIKADIRAEARAGETLVRFFTRAQRAAIPTPVPDAEWPAAPNSTLMLHHAGLLCVGLGDPARVTAQTLRAAAGTAVRTLLKAGRRSAALDLREYPEWLADAAAGAEMAAYVFQDFKAAKQPPMSSVRLIVKPRDLAEARRAVRRGEIAGAAANIAREIGNKPGNVIYPESLAAECRRIAKAEGLKITVLDEKALERGGYGGLMAVGSGSRRPPRLIILRHDGGKAGEAPIALVGKAITFDTGGISIKPAEKMEEMVFDKCGGMAVLGAMAGIARLKLKRNVVGLIASAENMPSSEAYRPGDIVKTYDGTYVEVINTDAEGRMVLADAIAYARQDCKARAIVDLATLTGACVVALGEYAAGLWSTDDALQAALLAASGKTGERLWPMPLYEEYSEQIRSDVAAIKNTGGRPGGACTAAAFLKTFARDTPWAHLDIAPVAAISKARPELARGATGFGTRLLIDLVEAFARS